jgi:hypothetical protein
LIPAIEDVVVNNQRRVSHSDTYGVYGKSRYAISGYSNSKTTSRTVGDISIMANGKQYVTFKDVGDPNGLAKVIKSIIKQCNYTVENNISSIQINESLPDVIKEEHDNIEVIEPSL